MPYSAEQLSTYEAKSERQILAAMKKIENSTVLDDRLLWSFLSALVDYREMKGLTAAPCPPMTRLPTLGLSVPVHYSNQYAIEKHRLAAMGQTVNRDMPRCDVDQAILALVPESERYPRT
jgi:hypothetical protein